MLEEIVLIGGRDEVAITQDDGCRGLLLSAHLGELPVEATPEGWVRTLPGTLEADGGCDGFFIARFRRAG